MKSQEAALYREIQRNTRTAITAMDTLSEKVYDDSLALQISGQTIEYSEIHNAASRKLMAEKEENYRGNALSDAVLKTGLHYNTMLNTSTGHIAELLIRESNKGILEMEKALRHNENAGEQPVALARQLIETEEKNIKRLKDYL